MSVELRSDQHLHEVGKVKYQAPFEVINAKNPKEYQALLDNLHKLDENNHPLFKVEDHFSKGGSGELFKVEDVDTGEQKVIKVLSFNNDLLTNKEPSSFYQNTPSSGSRITLQEIKAYSNFRASSSTKDTKSGAKIPASKLMVLENDPNILMFRSDESVLSGFKFKDAESNEIESAYAQVSMDYVPGTDLTELILKGSLSFDQIVNIMYRVILALETMHGQDLLHCDIKPDNIRVDNNGKPYLMDFGLSTMVRDGVAGSTSIQSTGFDVSIDKFLKGSPRFVDYNAQVRQGVFSKGSDLLSWMLVYLASFNFTRAEYISKNKSEVISKLKSDPQADTKMVEAFGQILKSSPGLPQDSKSNQMQNVTGKINKLSATQKDFLSKLVPVFKSIASPNFKERPSVHAVRLFLEQAMRECGYDIPKFDIDISKDKIINLGEQKLLAKTKRIQKRDVEKKSFARSIINSSSNFLEPGELQKLFHNLDMHFLRPQKAKAEYDIQQFLKQELLSKNYSIGKKLFPGDIKRALRYAEQVSNFAAKQKKDILVKNLKALLPSSVQSVKSYIALNDLTQNYSNMLRESASNYFYESNAILTRKIPLLEAERDPFFSFLESEDLSDTIQPEKLYSTVNNIKEEILRRRYVKALLEFEKYSVSGKNIDSLISKLNNVEDKTVEKLTQIVNQHVNQLKEISIIGEYRKLYSRLLKKYGSYDLENKKEPGKVKEFYVKAFNEKSIEDEGFYFDAHESMVGFLLAKSLNKQGVTMSNNEIYSAVRALVKENKITTMQKDALYRGLQNNIKIINEILKKIEG